MSHPSVYQGYVTRKVLGHFTERIIANTATSLILGSGQRWIRQRGQETAEEGKMHQRINWKGFSYQINLCPF